MAGNPDRPVYLAGPVDFTDDAAGWRDEIKRQNPGVEFVDPVATFPEYPPDPGEVVEWCLQQAERCDLLVANLGTAKTVGTHYEISRALAAGRTVVIAAPDPDQLSNFVTDRNWVDERGSIYYESTVSECLARLLDGSGQE